MKIPNEIREKILLAGEYYEKAWIAECEIRGWLKQIGLAKDLEETPIDEALVDYVRLSDGGTARDFIALLESLESEERINWEAEEPIAICYFSIDEDRDGEAWLECQGCMRRVEIAGKGFAWKLVEFCGGDRIRLEFSKMSELCFLEEEPGCWYEDEEDGDKADCLTSEGAAEYHRETCSGRFLLPTDALASRQSGWFYFIL